MIVRKGNRRFLFIYIQLYLAPCRNSSRYGIRRSSAFKRFKDIQILCVILCIFLCVIELLQHRQIPGRIRLIGSDICKIRERVLISLTIYVHRFSAFFAPWRQPEIPVSHFHRNPSECRIIILFLTSGECTASKLRYRFRNHDGSSGKTCAIFKCPTPDLFHTRKNCKGSHIQIPGKCRFSNASDICRNRHLIKITVRKSIITNR